MSQSFELRRVPGTYGIARLAADARVPDWLNGPGFSAMIRASDELTLVCLQDRIPAVVQAALDWYCFRSLGPFAFDATGIVQALITPLSSNGIGVFVVCTFDGEHIFVPENDWDKAVLLLQAAGRRFSD